MRGKFAETLRGAARNPGAHCRARHGRTQALSPQNSSLHPHFQWRAPQPGPAGRAVALLAAAAAAAAQPGHRACAGAAAAHAAVAGAGRGPQVPLRHPRKLRAQRFARSACTRGSRGAGWPPGCAGWKPWRPGERPGVILAEASYADELPFLTGAAAEPRRGARKQVPARSPTKRCARPTPAARPHRAAAPALFRHHFGAQWRVGGHCPRAAAARRAGPAGPGSPSSASASSPRCCASWRNKAAEHRGWLTLIGGAEPVPHARIVAEIGRSHLGLLPYQPHPSTERCRPTKLFEYLAHGLPVLARRPTRCGRSCWMHHGAGLPLDFGAAHRRAGAGRAAARAPLLPQWHAQRTCSGPAKAKNCGICWIL